MYQILNINDNTDNTDNTDKITDFINSLPKIKKKKHQFLLNFEFENLNIYSCVRELYWHEALDIETQSLRRTEDDIVYLSGEYERREILKKAIVWIATIPDCTLDINDGNILKTLKYEVVEQLWSLYYPNVTLAAEEALALYSAAKHYFQGNSNNQAVPSLIVEIDMMIKFGGLNRKELKYISISEMERMQTIFMARAEALGLNNVINNNINNISQNTTNIDEYKDLLPPHVKNNLNDKQFLNKFS